MERVIESRVLYFCFSDRCHSLNPGQSAPRRIARQRYRSAYRLWRVRWSRIAGAVRPDQALKRLTPIMSASL